MTSKERVLAALAHKEPDRVPVDFGGTAVTGIHVKIVVALRDRLRPREAAGQGPRALPDARPHRRGPQAGPRPRRRGRLSRRRRCSATATRAGSRGGSTTAPRSSCPPISRRSRTRTATRWSSPKATGPSRRRAGCPRADSSSTPSSASRRSTRTSSTRPTTWRSSGRSRRPTWTISTARAKEAAATGRAVMATFGGLAFGDIALVPAPFLKHPRGIRDIEEWYVSTLTRPAYVHAVFERQTEIALANLARIAARVGDRVQVVFVCGTDFGTQTSPVLLGRRLPLALSALLRRINDWIHAHTSWKTFKHSCGAVEPLIPAFIEAGFDILNPVQGSAAGMEAEKLKADFGPDLVFWGGGVDTQKTLMFGDPGGGPRPKSCGGWRSSAGRRVRLQRHPQHPGQRPGRQRRRPVRSPAGAPMKSKEPTSSTSRSWPPWADCCSASTRPSSPEPSASSRSVRPVRPSARAWPSASSSSAA